MRQLLLLRHAKTETDAPDGRDMSRRLDARGRRDSEEIGNWLAAQPATPDLVLVSTAVRAEQTWNLVERAFAAADVRPKTKHLEEIYGAGPAELLEIVRDHGGDAQRVMVVAHNPGLHELAFSLTGSGDAVHRAALADNMPTSGVAIFEFDVTDWNGIAFRGGRLANFVSPKLLKNV